MASCTSGYPSLLKLAAAGHRLLMQEVEAAAAAAVAAAAVALPEQERGWQQARPQRYRGRQAHPMGPRQERQPSP